MDNLFDIHKLLICATPQAWLEAALENQDILLIDHANCEKKAAATAMSLMFQYGERYPQLQEILSPLAREELRHFEQVTRLMRQRGVRFRALSAARYAGGLRKHVRKREPERLLDLLVLSALLRAFPSACADIGRRDVEVLCSAGRRRVTTFQCLCEIRQTNRG